MDFDQAFELLIGHEGGFQKNPKDRGNWTSGKIGVGTLRGTKFGVSAMTYPHIAIEALTLDEAKRIYHADFWLASKTDRLPEVMRFDMFDTAVHAGPVMAVRFVQQAAKVAVDGVFGPKTTAAVQSMDQYRLFARFNGARLDFLNNNPVQWAEFGRGWAQRIADNLMRA